MSVSNDKGKVASRGRDTRVQTSSSWIRCHVYPAHL